MSAFTIREACPSDAPAIISYNLALATETEDKTLDPAVLSRGVETALADPWKIRYWVAELDGQVIGMAGVTFEWSDWRNGWIWWFQSVFVHPDHRGQGVLRSLFAAIQKAGADAGVIGWRLYVEQANHPAHKVYRALGLKPGGYDVYENFEPHR